MSAFDEIDDQRRAACAVDEIVARRREWYKSNKSPRFISAMEAVSALKIELTIVWMISLSLRRKEYVSPSDLTRFDQALSLISEIIGEV